jgi:1,4-dihydroxy-2-naphthoate octaprenyltransferase
MRHAELPAFVRHLRLPFQLALAPFFLLGSWLADTPLGWSWALASVAVHVGLYGGATVFNGFYDKDRGPIGMMRRPTPVSAAMRDAALLLQLVALALLFAVDWRAGLVGTALFVMGCAYSHPLWRWKSSTWKGLACVAGGQGALAVLLGSFATGVAVVTQRQLAVAAATSLLVLGMYPLTQIYQIDEDRARGDLTLPVRFGWRRAMLFAWPVASGGLALALFLLRAALPLSWGWLAAGASAALASYLGLWAARFARQGSERNHDWAMVASLAVAAPTGLALMVELTRRWP